MHSACKLNKQGVNIQPWWTPFLIWNQSVVPCPVITVASWPAYRFLRSQVRWSGIPTRWSKHGLLRCLPQRALGLWMHTGLPTFGPPPGPRFDPGSGASRLGLCPSGWPALRCHLWPLANPRAVGRGRLGLLPCTPPLRAPGVAGTTPTLRLRARFGRPPGGRRLSGPRWGRLLGRPKVALVTVLAGLPLARGSTDGAATPALPG